MFIEQLTEEQIKKIIRTCNPDYGYISSIKREKENQINVTAWHVCDFATTFELKDFKIENMAKKENQIYKKQMYKIFGSEYITEYIKAKERQIKEQRKTYKVECQEIIEKTDEVEVDKVRSVFDEKER